MLSVYGDQQYKATNYDTIGRLIFDLFPNRFEQIARRMEAPPKFVLDVVRQTVATARKEWPGIVRETGLPENMRERLYGYWGGLSELLRIRQ